MKRNKSGRRLFLALDFSDSFKASLARWRALLPVLGRPVPPENFHLTLNFLGEFPESRMHELIELISTPEQRFFELNFGQPGFLPRSDIAAIFPSTADDSSANSLAQLQRSLNRMLRPMDKMLRNDNKKFLPHITLFRNCDQFIPAQSSPDISETIREFVLMESVTIKSGVHYEVLESWPLRTLSIKERMLGIDGKD